MRSFNFMSHGFIDLELDDSNQTVTSIISIFYAHAHYLHDFIHFQYAHVDAIQCKMRNYYFTIFSFYNRKTKTLERELYVIK